MGRREGGQVGCGGGSGEGFGMLNTGQRADWDGVPEVPPDGEGGGRMARGGEDGGGWEGWVTGGQVGE